VQAKTPPAIIASIHAAALSALKDANVNKRLIELGYIPVGNKPDEFAQHIRADIDKQAAAIRALGIAAR
jgi:tripartite-type tricarboxylate transporter receptor subunit TctC